MEDDEIAPELFDSSQFDLYPKKDLDDDSVLSKVPVTIITGYLGSGKS